MKTIDLVIPMYNGSATITACLGSVAAQQLPGGWSVTVTVVDDASTDGSVTIVSAFENLEVRLISNARNLGRAGTRNAGMRQGDGEIVVFLDCDCVLENRHVLNRFIELTDSGADCVFANVISENADFSGRFTNDTAKKRFKAAREGDFLVMTSACFAIRRSVLCDIGGFFEGYTRYGFEDRDFIATLQVKGHRMAIDGKCLVHHIETFDPHTVARKFCEAAKYSAPVFSRRFPDVYRRSVYGKIDPRTGSRIPRFFHSLAVRLLPMIETIAANGMTSRFVPYPVGRFLLQLTSSVAYFVGCLDETDR